MKTTARGASEKKRKIEATENDIARPPATAAPAQIQRRKEEPEMGDHSDGVIKPVQNEAERFQLQLKYEAPLDTLRKATIFRMKSELVKLFPNALKTATGRNDFQALMQRSFARADQVSTEEDALRWADGFRMPAELATDTEQKLQDAGGDFNVMVARMRDEIDAVRLSVASIDAALSIGNPEIAALKELAAGMPTLVKEGYKPTADELPHIRGGLKRVGTAVEKLIHDNFIAKKLAFVMRVGDVPEGTLIHPAGWAPKAGAAKGRNTGDLGDMGGGTPLNSEEQKIKYEARWGGIHNPTVNTFDVLFSKLLAEIVPPGHVLSVKGDHPDDPAILVMDLEGAYTLLSYLLEQVRLIATLISAGLVVFFLCGIFGWTGTPFAFNVVTRAIVWELERRLNGLAAMYVDDIAAGCLRRHLKGNIAVITQICTTLLGPKAIKEAKTVVADGAEGRGWKATIIGYDFDLKLRRITISPKNIERAFYGFLAVDVDLPVTVETMERLASWASRYAAVQRMLTPFISPLYSSYTWMASRNPLAKVYLSPAAKRAIRMIRVFLILSHIDPEQFARPFQCDIARLIRFIIEFDASLTGLGMIIFCVDVATGEETPVGVASVSIEELGFRGMSGNQNLSEFVAATIGVRAVIALGGCDCGVAVRGDSIAALSWIERERFSGKLVGNAAMIYVVQAIAWGIRVEQVTHLPAEQNTAADYLSRINEGGRTLEGFRKKFPQFKDAPVVDTKPSGLVPLCDPQLDIESDAKFTAFWRRAQAVVGGRTMGSGVQQARAEMT